MPELRTRARSGSHRTVAALSSEPSFRRRRASPWLRLMLRVPRYLYVGPLAELLQSRCVLLLTTRGRRTGLARTTAVSFMPLPNGHLVIFSGWGVASAWYRNVLADPRVRVKVGRRQAAATATLVEDPQRRIALMQQMAARSSGCGPPKPVRPLLKLTRVFDYDGEIAQALRAGASLPVVEITPD
jgi:deazaflavin-dependent oxidoreductase (nitroreductase family)